MTEEPEIEPEPRPILEIKSFDDVKRILTIARGGDPDAIQAISEFMDFKSNIERSYFPDKITTLCIAQLMGHGKTYFRNDGWDPFTLVADCLAVSHMPYKGFKSNQFVDMTRQAPNLDALQSVSEQAQRSFIDRALGRGKTEE